MTGKIYEFKRLDGITPQYQTSDAANTVIPVKLKTNRDIFQDVYQNVIADWQRYAAQNKLNEYILGIIPPHSRAAPGADYVNDLNVIAGIEIKLDMRVAIFYPGCTQNNLYGWLVAFHRNDEIFSTPPDMASEANARVLNILLYLIFGVAMKNFGRD